MTLGTAVLILCGALFFVLVQLVLHRRRLKILESTVERLSVLQARLHTRVDEATATTTNDATRMKRPRRSQ